MSVMHVFTTDSFVSSHNGEGEADCGWSTSSVDDGDDGDDVVVELMMVVMESMMMMATL